MTSTLHDVVAVTSLALEACIARGPGVSVICNQAFDLGAALEIAAAHDASGIISFGIAGGLAPYLLPGDWVVASAVRSGSKVIATDRLWTQKLLEMLPRAVYAQLTGAERVISTPGEKAQLYNETGAAAVDMESHIAAEVATAHRVPFAACRVIIDSAYTVLPPAAMLGVRSDGTPDFGAVIRSVLKMPRQLPDLIRTAFDACIAQRALSGGRKRLGVALGFPFNELDSHHSKVTLYL
jgi:hopanoid-associated phosphorylase